MTTSYSSVVVFGSESACRSALRIWLWSAGFEMILLNAEAFALPARVVARLAGDDYDGDVRVHPSNLLQGLDAVHLGQGHV